MAKRKARSQEDLTKVATHLLKTSEYYMNMALEEAEDMPAGEFKDRLKEAEEEGDDR